MWPSVTGARQPTPSTVVATVLRFQARDAPFAPDSFVTRRMLLSIKPRLPRVD